MNTVTIVNKNVTFCSSITPISSLVKLCGNRLPLTPRVSELGGLAFPTKTFRENRVEVRAAARDLSPFGRSDPPRPRRPPEMPKNTPLDSWGQATNARYACVVIKRAPTGRFGSKILTLICQLYVFTSTSPGRAAAVEVPNPTNLALTDGATVDFDESGVKRRSTCTQQPTVPNAGGARGHLGSRRAKTRMGRHLARRPAWRGVDGRVVPYSRVVPQR